MSTTRSEDVDNFLVALEGRDQVCARKFGARPREHFAGDFETTIASGGARAFHRFQHRFRYDDAGDLVVQAQSLLVAVERPDADQDWNGGLAAEFFHEGV